MDSSDYDTSVLVLSQNTPGFKYRYFPSRLASSIPVYDFPIYARN